MLMLVSADVDVVCGVVGGLWVLAGCVWIGYRLAQEYTGQ